MTSSSIPPAGTPAPGLFRGLIRSWVQFWFTPADPVGLHWLRALAGICFLCWLLPFAGNLEALYGLLGWFDLRAYQEAVQMQEGPPPISWSILYLCGTNTAMLEGLYWSSVGILVLFTLGIAPRITSILTWIIVVSFTANPAIIDDAEAILPVIAFYLMLGYVLSGPWQRRQSWATRLLGSKSTFLLAGWFRRGDEQPSEPNLAANIAVRLLQVHFAIIILISGLHKLQFGDWWAGAALWYPLHPPFQTTLEQMRAHAAHPIAYLCMLSIATYSILAWEIAFPLFAWRPRLRILLVGGGIVGWLGAALIYELPMLGPVILIGCLSYLTTTEWRWATDLLNAIVGLVRRAPTAERRAAANVNATAARQGAGSASALSGRRS
jgi:hypothetical protein